MYDNIYFFKTLPHALNIMALFLQRLLHWFWKLTRYETECDYFCATCPYYENCRLISQRSLPIEYHTMEAISSPNVIVFHDKNRSLYQLPLLTANSPD